MSNTFDSVDGVVVSKTEQAKARSFTELRDVIGYIENGGSQSIKIFQDDATRTWHLHIIQFMGGVHEYWDDSLQGVIHKAHAAHHELIDPI